MGVKGVSKLTLVFLALTILLQSSFAMSGSGSYLRKGSINNHNGQECWYRQTVDKENRHFFGRLAQAVGVLSFDNPNCMKGSSFEMDVNKMMINNIVSRW